MFEVIYISQIPVVPEGDKRAYDILSFFFGDDAECFVFQMILVDMITQKQYGAGSVPIQIDGFPPVAEPCSGFFVDDGEGLFLPCCGVKFKYSL